MLKLWHKFANCGNAFVTEWYRNYEYVFWGTYMQAESKHELSKAK